MPDIYDGPDPEDGLGDGGQEDEEGLDVPAPEERELREASPQDDFDPLDHEAVNEDDYSEEVDYGPDEALE